MPANVIEVSALNKYVRSLLESDPVLTDVAIKGEISNFNKHFKTGHCYFSIKDANSSVKAVMFRKEAEGLNFNPENGLKVIVRCRVSLYERDGAFQLYVDAMFLDGIGAMQIAFDKLKAKLLSEGLFEDKYKKAIPDFPSKVGIVTSKTGAALQDVLNVASRRCPFAELVLSPTPVQGNVADDICSAIEKLDNKVELIIITRGGGSSEDLWVFNDEKIARCVFACETPVVSAIGHEIDFTILDFVADFRAPTPSAAAELAFPDIYGSYAYMHSLCKNISKTVSNKLFSCYNVVNNANIKQSINRKFELSQNRLKSAANLAYAVNPYAILGRGYSITKNSGNVVKNIGDVNFNDNLTINVSDGIIHAVVNKVEKTENKKD